MEYGIRPATCFLISYLFVFDAVDIISVDDYRTVVPPSVRSECGHNQELYPASPIAVKKQKQTETLPAIVAGNRRFDGLFGHIRVM